MFIMGISVVFSHLAAFFFGGYVALTLLERDLDKIIRDAKEVKEDVTNRELGWDDVFLFNEDGENAYVEDAIKYDFWDIYKMVLDYIKDTVGDFDEVPNPDCITIRTGFWKDVGTDGMREFVEDKSGKQSYFINFVK